MVSLREGALKLLGLRGKFEVDGRVTSELTLTPGLRIKLSDRSTLEVLEVVLPDHLLMVEASGLGRILLSGPLSRLADGQVVAGTVKDAPLVFWFDGESWFARSAADGLDVPLNAGETVAVAGLELNVRLVRTTELGAPTEIDASTVDEPLELVVRYDTVHIHRGQTTMVLEGQLARFVSDLAVAGVPMGWLVLASELWPQEKDPVVLRRNWDAAMSRLRRRLREVGIRADLVRADRTGNVELFLRRGDRVVDQT